MTQQYPQHGFGWKVLGAVLKQTGSNADALDPMQKAVMLTPSDAEAYNNLGSFTANSRQAQSRTGKYAQGVKAKAGLR